MVATTKSLLYDALRQSLAGLRQIFTSQGILLVLGCFLRKPLQGLAVLGKLLRQELQGHIAAQPGVLGLVDHTHTTATQLLCDFVVGDGLADHG